MTMTPEEFQATKVRIAAERAVAESAARRQEWKIAGWVLLIAVPLITGIAVVASVRANAPPPPPSFEELRRDCAIASSYQAVANGPRRRAEAELANAQLGVETTKPGDGEHERYLRQRVFAMQNAREAGPVDLGKPQVCHDYSARLRAVTTRQREAE